MPNNRNEKVELRLDTNTLRPLSGAGRKLFVETYGCQMNAGDSEIVVSIMQDEGYVYTADISEADVILINTCSIRDNAEQRIWGRLNDMRRYRKARPSLVVGIIGCPPRIDAMPAFTGFQDTLAPTGTSLGYLFPALFVTIACGAISGFHSLVGSGTTAKQLNNERDARPIAYGGMLIESALAIISLCAVAYIWKDYADGTTVVPTAVFAGGLSSMLGTLFGAGAQKVTYSLLILAVSAFCLTSLDTATRLARYMFQEFWMKPGENIKDMTGARKVLTNPYVSTAITVVLGVALGMTGYAKIWALFGAANQLLAALGLLAVAAWLGKIGRNNKMFYFPMAFMLIVTLTSLVFTIKAQIGLITTGADVTWGVIRAVIAVLLIILAIDLVIEGVKALSKQAKAKTAAAE